MKGGGKGLLQVARRDAKTTVCLNWAVDSLVSFSPHTVADLRNHAKSIKDKLNAKGFHFPGERGDARQQQELPRAIFVWGDCLGDVWVGSHPGVLGSLHGPYPSPCEGFRKSPPLLRRGKLIYSFLAEAGGRLPEAGGSKKCRHGRRRLAEASGRAAEGRRKPSGDPQEMATLLAPGFLDPHAT